MLSSFLNASCVSYTVNDLLVLSIVDLVAAAAAVAVANKIMSQ